MNIPEHLEETEQPEEWVVSVDGIFIKQMLLSKKGLLVPQHVHKYDHHSMLATGSIRAWVDDNFIGDFKAPRPILIEANKRHTFMSLEDNTLIYCIHNLHGEDDVEILAEHHLEI